MGAPPIRRLVRDVKPARFSLAKRPTQQAVAAYCATDIVEGQLGLATVVAFIECEPLESAREFETRVLRIHVMPKYGKSWRVLDEPSELAIGDCPL
jgi:hypothetical protein